MTLSASRKVPWDRAKILCENCCFSVGNVLYWDTQNLYISEGCKMGLKQSVIESQQKENEAQKRKVLMEKEINFRWDEILSLHNELMRKVEKVIQEAGFETKKSEIAVGTGEWITYNDRYVTYGMPTKGIFNKKYWCLGTPSIKLRYIRNFTKEEYLKNNGILWYDFLGFPNVEELWIGLFVHNSGGIQILPTFDQYQIGDKKNTIVSYQLDYDRYVDPKTLIKWNSIDEFINYIK